jgi:CxxC motif-containing protein (DUF1111 family)
MKHKILFVLALSVLVSYFIACEKLMPKNPAADQVMDIPLNGLTPAQYQLFIEGDHEFEQTYTAETGLGPIFVSTSCISCHSGDNKGHPFSALTRFGQADTNGNQFLDMGAPQLQNRALPGYTPELIPNGATFSKFIAPITAGVGFLELVSDADILALADPNDANSDGISGVPNWNTLPNWVKPASHAISKNGKYICRFGRKASTYNLHQQTVSAFNNDMGVTSFFLPNNPTNHLAGTNPIPDGDPEVDNKTINATIIYLQALQAPIQRNQQDEQVKKGKDLFVSIGCESCHKQTLKTGPSAIAPLNQVEFHPYTDLLLHDMGPELNDNYTEGSALVSEWRTTPLWGLGLAANAQGQKVYLLHDGRARSIEEAIEYHGGEGSNSRSKFQQLSQLEKLAIIQFLNSL